MKKTHLFILLILLSAWGCGKDGGSSGSGSRQEERDNRGMVPAKDGTYYTVLRPVNFKSNGFIPYGMATFKLQNDLLQVSISLDDDQAVPHRQTLHIGTRCPTLADDTNGDGYVDYEEAMRVVGKPIMPLDADLNSIAAGEEIYLKGPAMTYNKQASLAKINEDLGRPIGFEGRVILVHGTSKQGHHPVTLAAFNNEQAHLSLPIVCGRLEQIE